MKRFEAMIAAAVITGLVALGMLFVGINALLNSSSVAPANSPASAVTSAVNNGNSAQVAQLQAQVQQYQSQLDQANAQLQQYQQLLSALQARGVIRITPDGQIQLGRRGDGG